MTTLAELIEQAPDPAHGFPISDRQMDYGLGDWRAAIEVADPQQGSSIVWHDLPPTAVARIRWSRGSNQPRGRYVATTPTVEIWADDDMYAPWNTDNSSLFGVHVPLQVGLLMRFCVFRVADAATDLWFPQWTGRVRRWRDQQTSARDGWRFHRVDVIDLFSELVPVPIAGLSNMAWKQRFDDILTSAGWAFGSEVYGAETMDDGGGAVPTVIMPSRDAQDSALAELEAVLDPVGLALRTHKRGSLLAHPPPWDTFHTDLFDDSGLTVTGEEWVNPLLAYYPNGVVFSYDPTGDEVGFYPVVDGQSFGFDSDIEAVINELQVTFPSDGSGGGTDVYAKDDPVSADRFGRRPLPARSWLARNDDVVDSIVAAQAYTHLVAGAIRTNLDEPGAFPALMLLDHLDPAQVKHSTGSGRQIVTAEGSVRTIVHEVEPQTDTGVKWDATVLVDVDSTEVAAALNPVENLRVTSLTEFQADFAWTNPAQTVAPTGTQIRIPQVSTLWFDTAYPVPSFAWLGLQTSTTFRFEVRLIREVDGIVTAVSDVRSVTFTTPAATPPAPVDGGDGSIVVVTPPDEGCDLEWKLEESDDGGDTWTTVRSGDQTDLDYDAGTDTYTLDNSDYTYLDGHLYRQCIREVCEGTPGAWDCQAAPYNPLCTTPAQLGTAPFDDAVMFVPKVCENEIVEAVSGEEAAKGPAFAGFGVDADSNYTLTTAASGNVVTYGEAPNVPLEDTDRSVHWRGSLGTVEPTDPLIRVGRLRLAVIDVGGGVHKFAAIKSFSGGTITAIGTTTVAADTEYDVYATWDRDTATVAIIVDGTEEDTTEDAASYVNTPNLPTFSAKLPANSWCTELAAWNSVIAAASFNPLSISGLEAWYDASDESTIESTGSIVSMWEDKSGNGNDATNGSGTGPATGIRTLNGLNALDFAASSGMRIFTYTPASATLTIFVVALSDVTPSSQKRIISNYDGSGAVAAGEYFIDIGPSNNTRFYRGTDGAVSLASGFTSTEPHIVTAQNVPGTSSLVRLDGTESSTGSGHSTAPVRGLWIGEDSTIGTAEYWDGLIAEVLIYEAALTAMEVAEVEAYLTAKWGL